jgi:hypothetical protein
VLFALLLVLVGLGALQAQTGTINGTVLDDSTGLPLRAALVRFFTPHGLWVGATRTDSNGVFASNLDTGRYLVRFEKFGYAPEWFDNAREFADAFVLDLHADTALAADASLMPMVRPVIVTVTGTVTDSATGEPLANSAVAFLRPHRSLRALQFLSNLFGGPLQERWFLPGFGLLRGVVWVGLTDSAGNYEAHLLANEPHIAFAFKPGYLPEFYNNKISPFEADRLTFDGNTGGVNFELNENPLAVNTVSGTVADSSGTGVPSHVMLIRLVAGSALTVRYQVTDSLGHFAFQHVAPGRFLVKAIPVDGFAPAWHATSGCGVRNWHDADVVLVGSNVTGVDVCVRPWRGEGFGRIAGVVHPGGTGLFSVATEGGATVYAVSDATGEIAGYDVTESDGTYAIENLPAGTYSIVVDKEGFVSSTSPSVTLDESNAFDQPGNDVTITADPTLGVTPAPLGAPKEFSLHQNYPNPFNPTTTIKFDVPVASVVTVKIYNLIGQKVTIVADGAREPGAYAAVWNGTADDGAQLTSGIYFVKMVAQPLDGDKPEYTALRKMIMVK